MRHRFADAAAPIPVHIAQYPLHIRNSYESLFSALLDQVPTADRLVILGESFGGPLAIRLAAHLGARVERLILCVTFTRAFFRAISGLRHLLPWSALPQLLAIPGARPLAHRWLDPGFLQALSEVPVDRLRERLDAAATVDARASLAAIRAPIHYLQALPDLLVPAYCLGDFLTVRADVVVHRMAGTHFLLQQRPEAVANLLRVQLALPTAQ